MEPQQICVIRTDQINLAFMGRSASRSLMTEFIDGGGVAHSKFLTSFDDLNDESKLRRQWVRHTFKRIPHVLVLRNPIERFKSAKKMFIAPNATSEQFASFHYRPFLHNVNFDLISHIIKFKRIGEYLSNHQGGIMKSNDGGSEKRDIENVDFTNEMSLYDKFITKDELDPEDFKQRIKSVNYINRKSIKYRYRTWDM